MEILDLTKSEMLRNKYIKKFVNTTSNYYKNNIEKKKMYIDGLCYTGYLWDCLKRAMIISEKEADKILMKRKKIYIMWDIHTCERIFIQNYWKYPKTSILYSNTWLKEFQKELPEDIYIFDETLNWSIIYTHETDEQNNRYCLYVENNNSVCNCTCHGE